MRLPASIDELSAAWLTEALGRAYPGTVVTHLTKGTVIHGTATKVRLLLDYNDAGHAHGLPPTLWYKGGLEAHSDGEHMRSVYATEAAFYRELAPRLNMTLPRCFFVNATEGSGQCVLVLEDMLARNARFGHVTRPASPRLAANVLGQLARLHGSLWNDSLLKSAALDGGGQVLAAFVHDYLFSADNWQRCLALPRGRTVLGELADREAMDALVQRMLREDSARGESLVHGDAHLGNVCILPGDAASYLDWQTAMRGFWAHDVAYFLTSAVTVDDRRRHERDLIEHYTVELNRSGGRLDEATAWWEYRRHALYTYCWFACNPEWQPEEVSRLNAERAVTAMLDLDTLAAWRSS